MSDQICRQCGAVFQGRADASFCSPACRQRAHRGRQRSQAVEQASAADRRVAENLRRAADSAEQAVWRARNTGSADATLTMTGDIEDLHELAVTARLIADRLDPPRLSIQPPPRRGEVHRLTAAEVPPPPRVEEVRKVRLHFPDPPPREVHRLTAEEVPPPSRVEEPHKVRLHFPDPPSG